MYEIVKERIKSKKTINQPSINAKKIHCLFLFICVFSFIYFFKLKELENKKDPNLPWLHWRKRPTITSVPVNVNHFHYNLKRKTPPIPDVYFHDLPEDSQKFY